MSEPSSRSLEAAVKALAREDDARRGIVGDICRRVALALDAARAEERERCARIADEAAVKSTQDSHGSIWDIAAAIRAENIEKSEERTS